MKNAIINQKRSLETHNKDDDGWRTSKNGLSEKCSFHHSCWCWFHASLKFYAAPLCGKLSARHFIIIDYLSERESKAQERGIMTLDNQGKRQTRRARFPAILMKSLPGTIFPTLSPFAADF
jgi:hypothetical protein